METLFEPRRYQNGNTFPKFRAIILGNAEVGKTSLIQRYMNNNFTEEYFPTKDLIIYKNMINFFPGSDEMNEYVYVELIDTIAYDRGRSIIDFSNFFNTVIQNETLLSSTNPKIGKISEHIKYEFFYSKKRQIKKEDRERGIVDVDQKPREVLSKRKLFSLVNVMAYIFVFDYNDQNSLEDVHNLAKKIIEVEKAKIEMPQYHTVKVFIANKYPSFLDDDGTDADDDLFTLGREKNDKYPIYSYDRRAKEILELLRHNFDNEETAKQHIFFTNTKFNIGVHNSFRNCFEKLFQKEDLWNVKFYDSDEEHSDEEKKDEGKSFFSSIFCCAGDRGKDKKKEEKKTGGDKVKKQNEVVIDDKLEKKYYENLITEDGFDGIDPFNFKHMEEEFQSNKIVKNENLEVKDEKEEKEEGGGAGKCYIY